MMLSRITVGALTLALSVTVSERSDAQMTPAAVRRPQVARAQVNRQVVPLQVELIRRANRYINIGAAIGAGAGITYALIVDHEKAFTPPLEMIIYAGGGFAFGALGGLVTYAVTHPF